MYIVYMQILRYLNKSFSERKKKKDKLNILANKLDLAKARYLFYLNHLAIADLIFTKLSLDW